MTVVSAAFRRTWSSSSSPDMPGMRMSLITRSQSSASRATSASLAEPHELTSCPSRCSRICRNSCMLVSSSTTRIRAKKRPLLRRRSDTGCAPLRSRRRQSDPHRGSASQLTRDADPAPMRLHDAVYGRQTEPGALGLGRVERLEQALHLLGGDPAAVVLDGDLELALPSGATRQ